MSDTTTTEDQKNTTTVTVKKEVTYSEATRRRADIYKAGAVLDPNTAILETPQDVNQKVVEDLGLTKLKLDDKPITVDDVFNLVHQGLAAHTLAAGEISQTSWEGKTGEERKPVVAPLRFCDSVTYTTTHTADALRPDLKEKGSTTIVPHMIQQHLSVSIGKPNGEMKLVRAALKKLQTK